MPIGAQRADIQTFGEIGLRLGVVDDAFLLWQWTNDPITRANSFNTEAVPWDVHQSWYAKKLASPDCRLWIMEFEQIPVGQIRYDRISAEAAQISLSVAPVVRGRGLGTMLLELTAPMAARELGVTWVRGIALSENQASQRAFAKAGFTVAEHKRIANRECLIYQRGSQQ
jgi:UDP-2,4-diacetamido-2,4,6-trideoxy-beta-L-altropyranose hydrolase